MIRLLFLGLALVLTVGFSSHTAEAKPKCPKMRKACAKAGKKGKAITKCVEDLTKGKKVKGVVAKASDIKICKKVLAKASPKKAKKKKKVAKKLPPKKKVIEVSPPAEDISEPIPMSHEPAMDPADMAGPALDLPADSHSNEAREPSAAGGSGDLEDQLMNMQNTPTDSHSSSGGGEDFDLEGLPPE